MIRVRQLKVPILEDNEAYLRKKISNKLKVKDDFIKKVIITKKSIDARDKNNIFYVYEVLVDCLNNESILKKNRDSNIEYGEEEKYTFTPNGKEVLNNRIVIVGSGPCGLFCAYMLASWGYKPIVLERGDSVDIRVSKVDEFFKTNKLDVNSNIQFGEGGAGTFSDGKLNTLTKDKFSRQKKVFEIFIENGANPEIMFVNKPHIGTDVLRNVIVNMRNKIIEAGGEIIFNSCVTDLVIKNNKIEGVVVNDDYVIDTNNVVLAIGHSARDTFYMLNKNNVSMKNKNFAVGFRIEHPREIIDKSQYGEFSKVLGAASYKLTHQCSNGRSVYSFCMCPGGFVVNASSEEGRVCVNGMSNYKRDEKNSNSAIVVNILADEFGSELFTGMEFQRRIEEAAYKEGKGFIPVQLYKDFCENKVSNELLEVEPNTCGDYNFGNLNNVLPKELCTSIKEGINAFGKKIKGFDMDGAVLLGVEARTSSPINIIRGDNYESNISGVYPCGEGAGYAGGITTASVDGIRVAEVIASKYAKLS